MKFISWNIDSLNAALTSESARALLSRDVIKSIQEHNPDVIAIQETKLSAAGPTKKHTEILKETFWDYEIVWRSSVEPARKVMPEQCFYIKIICSLKCHIHRLVLQEQWTVKAI